MNNSVILAIYAPFALITVVVFVIELLRHFKRPEDYLFSLLCFCAVCWFASSIAGILALNEEVAKFFVSFSLIFVGFIPPILLLFALRFYKATSRRSVKMLVLLLLIPTINIFMAVTARHHGLMNASLDIISLSPFREMDLVWGPWFWVHTAYCYAVSLTLIGVILFRHFRMPRFYRLPSTLMVAGVFLTLLGNVVTLLQALPVALDPTLISMSLALILFNLAVINNNNSKFVRFSHRQIYNYLNIYILILDENKRVVDHNRPALTWFSDRGITLNDVTIMNVVDALLEKKNSSWRYFDKGMGVDYYIGDEDFPVVLNLRTHEMKDANGELIGYIAVFTDVTQNRMLIERLEEKAGMDSLTGLPNHMAYEGAKNRLNNPEHLPLSVIICDANGLKAVNDIMGHQYGDKLLQVLAGVLEKLCPRPGFVARVGGDEFTYLLPKAGQETANELIVRVKEELANQKGLPFNVSAAMGSATKHAAGDSLTNVIALADSRMYEDKKRMKQQAPAMAEARLER